MLGDLEFGVHLGKQEAVVLEAADRLAECLAVLGVLQSLGRFPAPRRRRDGDRQPLRGQVLHQVVETAALVPSRLAAGTRTSSKFSSEVSWACRPILSSLRPRVKPACPARRPAA